MVVCNMCMEIITCQNDNHHTSKDASKSSRKIKDMTNMLAWFRYQLTNKKTQQTLLLAAAPHKNLQLLNAGVTTTNG